MGIVWRVSLPSCFHTNPDMQVPRATSSVVDVPRHQETTGDMPSAYGAWVNCAQHAELLDGRCAVRGLCTVFIQCGTRDPYICGTGGILGVWYQVFRRLACIVDLAWCNVQVSGSHPSPPPIFTLVHPFSPLSVLCRWLLDDDDGESPDNEYIHDTTKASIFLSCK